jgi:hypothetical protein
MFRARLVARRPLSGPCANVLSPAILVAYKRYSVVRRKTLPGPAFGPDEAESARLVCSTESFANESFPRTVLRLR